MLRSGRSLWATSARGVVAKPPSTPSSRPSTALFSSLSKSRLPRQLTSTKPLSLVHKTYYASKPANPEEEKKWAEAKLEPHPESVSTESSVRHFLEPNQSGSSAKPVQEGIAHDLVCTCVIILGRLCRGGREYVTDFCCSARTSLKRHSH